MISYYIISYYVIFYYVGIFWDYSPIFPTHKLVARIMSSGAGLLGSRQFWEKPAWAVI